MEEDLRAKLKATSSVNTPAGGRIDWGLRPQGNAMPAIALNKPFAGPDIAHDGSTGLSEADVRLECWANTYGAAKTLARAALAALHGFKGTVGSTVFQGIIVEAERDDYERDEAGAFFRTTLDLTVWHKPQA